MAPELLNGRLYNKSVDIWSFGVIMYMLLNEGNHPYYDSNSDIDHIKYNITNISLKK